MGDKPVAAMVTENIVMHRTDEDPRLLTMVGIAAAQANAINVDNWSRILRLINKRCPK